MTKISRRGFLKLFGATVAIATLGPVISLVQPEEILTLDDVYQGPYFPNYSPQALVELRNPEVLVAQGWLPIELAENDTYKLWLEAERDLYFGRIIINGPRSRQLAIRQNIQAVYLQKGDTFEITIHNNPNTIRWGV